MRAFIQDSRNHFPDLDARAELLADELRLAPGGLNAALGERLRARHGLGVRVLPVDVMPDYLRRLDYHGCQLQLSELLDEPSRTFAAAYHLGLATHRQNRQASAHTKSCELLRGSRHDALRAISRVGRIDRVRR